MCSNFRRGFLVEAPVLEASAEEDEDSEEDAKRKKKVGFKGLGLGSWV